MKPNYAFAKRQRDLARKAKLDEKQARKREKAASTAPVAEKEPAGSQPQ